MRLHPHGLDLGGGSVLPLWAGAMHYWRHPPSAWRPGLEAMRAMGLRLVDTYVPWGVHERAPGDHDFGEQDARLDVAAFLSLAHEVGLECVLRPGPHVNAELTWFGLPERIVWDPQCQARGPGGHPVMLPAPPLAFPVPSYASDAFLEETARWYRAVGKRLSHLRWPDGPIVMVQVDNEGALYFRDGPYDQDYHPDAVHAFRDFLRGKHRTLKALRRAWDDDAVTFAAAEPPRRFDPAQSVARHLDWTEFHEQLLADALQRMKAALVEAGLGGVPTLHNLPPGESATPLDPSRMTSIDLVGLDYYHRASPAEHWTILRRTTKLVSRAEALERPAYAAEMGAGFAPYFPPIDELDSMYTLMCAMAYGLRGFNVYMAVERDRWIGAPVDPHGRPRPMAARYARLLDALVKVKFHTLRRRAPVRLVVPRELRRLARVTHAFGPLTPALFNVAGATWRESVLETEQTTPQVVEAEACLRAFEQALHARGVPFAYVGGEHATVGARWLIRPAAIGAALDAGRPAGLAGLAVTVADDPAAADALVAARVEELALPAWPVDPPTAHVTVHEDDAGPRVVFVMNPTPEETIARVALPQAAALADLLGPERVTARDGRFEVTVPGRVVRMMRVEGP